MIHPRVRRDVRGILDWYDARSDVVGDRFHAQLMEALDAVTKFPGHYPFIGPLHRRYTFKNFPYHLVFDVTGNDLAGGSSCFVITKGIQTTQWLRRLAEFSVAHQVTVQLACYPPYHSKYNPVERVFGVLENYWNGDPLLSIDHALGMAAAMTYKGVSPETSLHPGGSKGTRLAAKAMKGLEGGLERLEGLTKWFIKFVPDQVGPALKRLGELKLQFNHYFWLCSLASRERSHGPAVLAGFPLSARRGCAISGA